MTDVDRLIVAGDDPMKIKDFAVWGLIVAIVPRADQFYGKHGTGLITYAELLGVMEQAEFENQLVYKS